MFVSGPPRADASVLRTDRFYDASATAARTCAEGDRPESAVLWRLDRPESLLTADEELTRRLTYQPLGKYWAFPLARAAGGWLCPTSVRPNHLTLAAAALMLSAAGLIAAGAGGWLERSIVALALALALVLDTADGRLARLQGTSSAFGRWLDQVLDELADLALHAAIAWAAFLHAVSRSGWSSESFTPRGSTCSWFSRSSEMSWRRGASETAAPAGSLAKIRSRSRLAVSVDRLAGCRAHDRPCRRAVASLDRAGARGPARRRAGGLRDATSRRGPWPARSGRGCVMPEPRLSVLVVAKNEAHNLADCLASASWADERVVVVDPASRDATLEIAERDADVVAVRGFDDFASQRNAALALASGDWVLSIDADERVTPALAAEIRRVIADPATSVPRVPRADPQRDPGPAVRLFRNAARPAAAPVPPRFRPLGRPGSRDGRAQRVDRGSSERAAAPHAARMSRLSQQGQPLHDAGSSKGWPDRARRYRMQRPDASAASGRFSSSMSSSKGFVTGSKGSCSARFPASRWRSEPGSTAS